MPFMSSDETDVMTDALASLLAALFGALEAFAIVQRRLHPSAVGGLASDLAPYGESLAEALEAVEALDWPEHLSADIARLRSAGECAREIVAGMLTLPPGNEMFGAYGTLRRSVRCHELLLPLAPVLPSISRMYLEEPVRASVEHANRCVASPASAGVQTGLIDLDNGHGTRGGASLYVPEFYDAAREWPLVVALHGGSGHGAQFLWTWLREARSRGFLLLAPTSRSSTWSLEQPEFDAEGLMQKIEWIEQHWNVDRAHVLLTGISDGATYSLLCGLLPEQPYTHIAALSGVLGPLTAKQREKASGMPIYLVHGALDWMFPVEIARLAHQTLSDLGAEMVYREISDLSHTYAREENGPILEWFDASLALPD